MSRTPRSWAFALPALALMAWSLPARAWLEVSVVSDAVTIDVARDGTAVVAHELLLKIRGKSFKEFELTEVDPDADPLPDATLTLASSGRAAGLPMPLSVGNEGGRLVARVLDSKAIRYSGSYLGRVRYRTDFKKLGRVRAVGPFAELKWQTPVFDNGIDTLRVLWRFPRAPTAPELPKADTARADVGIAEEFEGVFLGTSRRSGDVDELEIVRPHVGKGERVYWPARVDPKAFDFPIVSAPTAVAKDSRPPTFTSTPPRRPIWPWLAAAGFALLYGALVALKSRWVRLACEARDVTPTTLVPMSATSRTISAMAALTGAILVALQTEYTTAAGVLMVLALSCAVHATPRGRAALRGPGRWVKTEPAEAFSKRGRPPKLPGRFLDAGSFPGFLAFFVLLSGFVTAAILVGRRSPFSGVAIALGSACLFPLFCTGRASELPANPLETARSLLRPIYRALRRSAEATVAPVLRFPEGRTEPDELRLVLEPKRAKRGLVSMEVGYDAFRGPTTAIAVPYVIVRAMDGSDAFEALPKGLLWTRGRSPDERVTVLRPRLPTQRATLSLARRIVATLGTDHERAVRQLARSAKNSSGTRSSTSKPKTASSPAHAT